MVLAMIETLGQIIMRARLAAGYRSAPRLAAAVGISANQMRNIEKDHNRPLPETLRSICSVLRLDYNEMLRAAGYPPVNAEGEMLALTEDELAVLDRRRRLSPSVRRALDLILDELERGQQGHQES